jgi:predicted metalloprotease
MIKLLRKLLGFCEHNFFETHRIKLFHIKNPEIKEGFGYEIVFTCEKCGKNKSTILINANYDIKNND